MACRATAWTPACSAAATMRSNASFRRTCSKTLPLSSLRHCQAREYHDRNGVFGQPLDVFGAGAVSMRDFTDDERVEPDDPVSVERDVGTRRVRLLVLQRVPLEEAIQRRRPAVEPVDDVGAVELLDAKGHSLPLEDAGFLQELGEARQVSRRRIERCLELRPLLGCLGRSASDQGSVSAARWSALSRTKSDTERPLGRGGTSKRVLGLGREADVDLLCSSDCHGHGGCLSVLLVGLS